MLKGGSNNLQKESREFTQEQQDKKRLRQEQKQMAKKKLSNALRQNLMRRKSGDK